MSDLVTLQEYKSYVGITSNNQDTQINAIIPKVSQLVKTICKRDFESQSYTETYNGGGALISLQYYPVLGVDSVEISRDFGKTYTALVEYDNWVWDGYEGCVRSTYTAFDYLPNGYRVSYRAGYDEVPPDLKLAVLDLVTYYLRNDSAVHSTKAPGSNSVQIEYISTTNLPTHIKRVLDLYMLNYN